MKKTLLSLLSISLILLFVFTLSGCKEEISKAQLREMQTRVIKSDVKTAFKAARSVFVDLGYVVKESELESGFIQAETGEKPPQGCLIGSRTSEQYLANCNIENADNGKVQMRINLQSQSTTTHTSGGYYGLFASTYQTKDAAVVTDPETYNALFNEIETEIARRKRM